jgi:hypothetical protein
LSLPVPVANLIDMAATAKPADSHNTPVKPPRGRRALRQENERLRIEVATLSVEVEQLRAELVLLRQRGDRLTIRLTATEVQSKWAGAQLADWTAYATSLGATTSGLQEWVDWYAIALGAVQEELRAAEREVTKLRSDLADREIELAEILRRQMLAPPPAPIGLPASPVPAATEPSPPQVELARSAVAAAPIGVEIALREQIVDLRTRLDHAAELVDHIVRQLVAPPAPPSPNSGVRLNLPLVQSSFSETEKITPLDLAEDYPWLQDRPTA